MYQRFAFETFSGYGSPPASSASTETSEISERRAATHEPAEPVPTTMKSYSLIDSSWFTNGSNGRVSWKFAMYEIFPSRNWK